jgi:hypothetical protein
MSDNNVERLRTDAVLAEEIRTDMKEPLAKVCEIMNRARASGLTVNLAIMPDQYGRFRTDLGIVKPL